MNMIVKVICRSVTTVAIFLLNIYKLIGRRKLSISKKNKLSPEEELL